MNRFCSLFFILMITSIALMVTACAVRKSEPVENKVFDTTDEEVVKGEHLYMMHCQKCHPAGEGGLGPAINSNPAPQMVKRFQVRHGLGVMPSFKTDEISRDDLKRISRYMKVWKNY